MATNANNSTKTADELAGTVRSHAQASIKDAQSLATATVDHTREVTAAVRQSAFDSATRAGDVAVEAWKTWSAAPFATVPTVDVAKVVNAGFDMAGGVLDAQRQLAQRLVDAASPAAR